MSDGSVEGTDLIQRDGNFYTFTDDIFGTLTVEKDGITIDVVGYAIKGRNEVEHTIGRWGIVLDLNKKSDGISTPGYGDIVVKNVRFCDRSRILTSSNSNNFINNTFEGGGIEIKGGYGGKENVINCNVFIDGRSAIFADYSGVNVVAENDFINCSISLGLYGGLSFDRNYWSDYTALYPDAKEVGNTGIWDTPYTYSKAAGSGGRSFVDYNPLVNPTNGAGAPPGVNETSTSTVSTTPTDIVPTASTDGDESKSFPTTQILIASVACVVIACTCLLVNRRRHRFNARPVAYCSFDVCSIG
jgi:hypothetical protein